MPADPETTRSEAATANGPPDGPVTEPRWHRKLSALLFVLFCLEVGVFLVVFPWLDEWSVNYFAAHFPWGPRIWDSPYFRGAVSGLGVVNIYISLLETFRLRRLFARRHTGFE